MIAHANEFDECIYLLTLWQFDAVLTSFNLFQSPLIASAAITLLFMLLLQQWISEFRFWRQSYNIFLKICPWDRSSSRHEQQPRGGLTASAILFPVCVGISCLLWVVAAGNVNLRSIVPSKYPATLLSADWCINFSAQHFHSSSYLRSRSDSEIHKNSHSCSVLYLVLFSRGSLSLLFRKSEVQGFVQWGQLEDPMSLEVQWCFAFDSKDMFHLLPSQYECLNSMQQSLIWLFISLLKKSTVSLLALVVFLEQSDHQHGPKWMSGARFSF